jgi:chromosomal replication initiator protein
LEKQLLLGEDDSFIAFKNAWREALKLLSPEINKASFQFFLTAKPVSSSGRTVMIGAASELAKIFLEKYSELIKAALDSVLGWDVRVAFVVAKPEPAKSRQPDAKRPKPVQGGLSSISLPLNDKYDFDHFVVGTCNRLAHAVAKSVSEKPGEAYNPFFLYGGPGLGKTHILQAIGHHIIENFPQMRVAYVSGETFTSHYVNSLREHKSEEFRRKYRSIDIWLMDDIQFLTARERTKEEFFHTFNELYQMNKQIVLSSDRSPRDLNPLEERLRSRFESGIVSDIAAPDLETRIAILQNKATSEEFSVPYEVLESIAEMIPTNIRALEGALVTLMAYSSLMKTQLDVSLAQQVLSRYMSEKKRTELTPDAVQRAVSKVLEIELSDLVGEKRRKDLVTARHAAMYLSRELTDCSLATIGKAFGGRNHATVVHACSHVKELIEHDSTFKETIDRVVEILKGGRW